MGRMILISILGFGIRIYGVCRIPGRGSDKSIVLDGTVTVRKVFDGRAQLEEIEADGPNGHWQGLTLFLYNPQAHQWSQSFIDSKMATLSSPEIGAFHDGRGELFSSDTFNGEGDSGSRGVVEYCTGLAPF